jgi:hypothetical protein
MAKAKCMIPAVGIAQNAPRFHGRNLTGPDSQGFGDQRAVGTRDAKTEVL